MSKGQIFCEGNLKKKKSPSAEQQLVPSLKAGEGRGAARQKGAEKSDWNDKMRRWVMDTSIDCFYTHMLPHPGSHTYIQYTAVSAVWSSWLCLCLPLHQLMHEFSVESLIQAIYWASSPPLRAWDWLLWQPLMTEHAKWCQGKWLQGFLILCDEWYSWTGLEISSCRSAEMFISYRNGCILIMHIDTAAASLKHSCMVRGVSLACDENVNICKRCSDVQRTLCVQYACP